jgi:ABC-type transport system involved in multi-copper enzyme maturation permease subunit
MPFGPLFWFELVRLARRGGHLPLRVVLCLLLLVGLFAAYRQLFPKAHPLALLFGAPDSSQLDKFGETFLLAVLVIQQAAVVLLTPVYAGGAIAEEKETGRLDFLLTSPLGRWELVCGKLAARLVFVLGVVFTGLPVLAFTLLFGGVSPERVLAGFVVSAVSAVAVGAFAVLLSVLRPTVRDVLVAAFAGLAGSGAAGLIAGYATPHMAGGAISPVTVLVPLFTVWKDPPPTGDPTWPLVGVYSAIQLGLAAVYLGVAVARLRPAAPRPTDTPVSVDTKADPEPSPEPAPPPAAPPPPDWYRVPERPVFGPDEVGAAADGRDFLVPPLGDREDPLAWKERHFGANLPVVESQVFTLVRGCAVAAFLFALGMGLFVGLIVGLPRGEPFDVVNPLVRLVLGVAVLTVPFAGVRAAVGVAEERAKRTLDSLFALPIDRRDVLWAKVREGARRGRWWAFGAATAVGLGAITLQLHPFGVAAVAALFAGYGAFTLGLGVWLGVRGKSAVRAVLTHLTVTLITFVAPVVAVPLVGETVMCLSPPVAVVRAAVTTTELSRPDYGWAVCLAVPVGLGYATAGLVLWRLAVRRFERE